MPSPTVKGRYAELLVAEQLRQLGLHVLTANYRYRRGEIDLVCSEGDTLCFVEVRYRSAEHAALASVAAEKQRRIARTAEHYLATSWRGAPCACRFDVVAVEEVEGDLQITLIRDAFRQG